MAVTPLAWTDMAWSDLRGRLPAPALEALRLALIERAEAAGEQVPDLLLPALEPGQVPLAAWAEAVDMLAGQLIPRFVNHHDSGGNWDGLPECAPLWTEPELLAASGVPERLTCTKHGLLRAAWGQQYHDILNQLRWTRASAEIPAGSFERGQDRTSGSPSVWRPTWLEVLPSRDWQNPGEVTGGLDTRPLSWAFGTYHYSNKEYAGARYRYRARFHASGLAPTLAHAADLYLMARTFTPWLGFAVNEFDDNGEGWAEDQWQLHQTFAAAAMPERVSGWVGQNPVNNPPGVWPVEPPHELAGFGQSYTGRGFVVDQGCWVLRWDVVGGFLFID